MTKPLFDYRLRVSSRGRNVRLRVTVRRGLEVVVPRGYDTAKIPALLERKKHWIRAALERAEAHRKFFEPMPPWKLPERIELPAIGATWHVESRVVDVPWVAVRAIARDRLLVFGRIADQQAARAALHRWLARQTRQHLVPRLQSLSQRLGLAFERAYVKRQRTRWASCSRHKAISLNAKLLFLPPQLVDYVLVHELCHLAELNHTKRFWRLVQAHCPDYRKHDRALREMWKRVPRWAAM